MATRCRPESTSSSSLSTPVPITTGYGGSTATCTVTDPLLSVIDRPPGCSRGPAAGTGSDGPPPRGCGGWCRPGWSPHSGTAEPVSPSGLIFRVFLGLVSRGQQRPHGVATGAPHPFPGADLQVDDGVARERLAHPRAGDGAAAERHHAVVLC